MAKYIYPAIFKSEDDGGFSIHFPDIEGCYTCGKDLEDGLSMANDALSLMLVEMEDSQDPIPAPSSITSIKLKDGEFSTLITADTIQYRHVLNNMAVKKTLSIPAWLNDAATAAGINFSQTLQEALKSKLHLV